MMAASTEQTRELVRQHYSTIATTGGGGCGCGSGCCSGELSGSRALGYSEQDLQALPDGADLGLGCGTPLAFAGVREGETVLDLGSGAGIDCFLAAAQVGPTGWVIGVDMTAAMVEKARANAATVAASNVEFRLGEIEHLPVPDRSVDVVVSNCVVNLSPDKDAVFREVFRVLKPGGRAAIADIVSSAPLPASVRDDPAAFTGCVAGASAVDELRASLVDAGFADISIKINEASRAFIKDWLPHAGAEAFVASASIEAVRPAGAGCCGAASGTSCC